VAHLAFQADFGVAAMAEHHGLLDWSRLRIHGPRSARRSGKDAQEKSSENDQQSDPSFQSPGCNE